MPTEIQLLSNRAESPGGAGGHDWESRLTRSRYHFPAGGSQQDFVVWLDHAAEGCFFPLGTADMAEAAARARDLHQFLVREGWLAASRQFSRELIVSFEWDMNPLLWTYTTIHTLVDERPDLEPPVLTADGSRQRVLVVEPDAGIRRALCWSINQQLPFGSIPCASVETFATALACHQPRLVLLNRNLVRPLGGSPSGNQVPLPAGVTALTYSTHADGDRMFTSTPSGAEGYLIKRIKADRLLEPILDNAGNPQLISKNLLASVRSYFQELLQSDVTEEARAFPKLSRREREVLALLGKGLVDKEIAQALGISAWTVHQYVKSVFDRLNVHTRTEAVIRYLENQF